MKLLAIRKCANCECDIEIFHKARLEKERVYCSKQCLGEWVKKQNLNCTCPICGKKFHAKPYHLKRFKVVCCSRECSKKHKSNYMKGEGNHQYGLKGRLNLSWKSDKKITNYGYLKIRVLNHPFKDIDDMVFEHRLVAEQHLLTEENSVIIDNKSYLKPTYSVHHIDGNKLNNNVENLMVMTKAEHSRLHNLAQRRERNSVTGRFL